jgi:hypothetical protein
MMTIFCRHRLQDLSDHPKPKPANETSVGDIDANVLNEEKKQQVLALGRLGWPLRQIQKATASVVKPLASI